ncbi:MAG: polyribonucleotide nucleotidyltransferase [Deltaproteobacteria bacterium RIFOXYA12_FULL_58_15]|nr:MAG: polyribonucleotide nucleotidyltransferase [Deltaproteobacteria bacterium RIFOXYA12_FULL_58_15]OGR07293.1 MAG: polyribonucleotide nucleotidyltransferase [Deltaproteobacteria bacterium RIFOXYB12_FULL_58_9]
MTPVEKSVVVGSSTITFQTGKIAKQASGGVVVTAGDTMVLVTAQASKDIRPGLDFLPLTVDYQEKMSAAGRIPGGYFKRETRPRDDETLTSRLIDRSIRPLFAEGWTFESQLIATVFSYDDKHPADALAMTGASLALMLSDMPFAGPIAGIRVVRVDGKFIANPTHEEEGKSDLNVFVSCSRDAIVMVEGGGQFVSEQVMIDALLFAHEAAQPVIDVQLEMVKEAGKAKRGFEPPKRDLELETRVRAVATSKFVDALLIREKLPRYDALDDAKRDVIAALVAEDATLAERTGEIKAIMSDLKYDLVRTKIIKEKKRIDGRGLTDIRPITTEVGVLPRTHGSALFCRGETQGLVNVTLGTRQDEQKIEDLFGDHYRNFLLHYNFPPYSVGEVKPLRGPGRREVGHGTLARRALKACLQIGDDFPYTIRVMSDILESNGSSSMATVCGGSLAMMDAGVPMKSPCAGIAMGLIKEGDEIAILSDILGDEDHLGDMDFKVAGTKDGISAIQMDIKIGGVSREILEAALEQARVGRLHILKCMGESLTESRAEMSHFAPRITKFKIKVDRIRDVIGPGGKVIKDIVARTGCQVNVEDDGTVSVASTDGEASSRAIRMINDLTQEAEIGKIYLGNVRKITDFGAFVEIFPGTDGLVHISELANRRVNRVEDVLQEGDEVMVKCIGMDRGKVKLSRKQALEDDEQEQASDD